MKTNGRFSGKRVWITGASSGIGKALLPAFLREGALCVISSRRSEVLEALASGCGEDRDRVRVLPLDLEDLDSLPGAVETAWRSFGALDILINNAGITQRSFVRDTDFEVVDKLTKVNYLGPVKLSMDVYRRMAGHGGGSIVVVTSVAGKFSTPLRSAYAGAKHGLHGFFSSLEVEGKADGVKVSFVVPGFVRTDISRNAMTGDGSKYEKLDRNQAGGIAPEVCARAMLAALEKGKRELYTGVDAKTKLALFLEKAAPGVLRKLLAGADVT